MGGVHSSLPSVHPALSVCLSVRPSPQLCLAVACSVLLHPPGRHRSILAPSKPPPWFFPPEITTSIL